MAVKLDPRLRTIASLVRIDRRICDVGTDHALLPCYLYNQGAREIIACDINDGPLETARQAVIKAGAQNGITVIKSDGLKSVPPCDDVIIAGMGGELIARIVKECSFKAENTRFILQPMTKAEILRRELYKNGFEICSETGTESGGKIYTVLLVKYTGECIEIDDNTAYFGKMTDRRCIEAVNSRLKKLANGDSRFNALIRR